MGIRLVRKTHDVDVLGYDGETWLLEINVDDLPFNLVLKIPYDEKLTDTQIEAKLTAEYVKLARYADCVLQHHTERILYQLWRDVRSIKERLGME